MLTLRLPPELEKRLNRLAKRTGRPKAFYAKQAISEYLDEREDILIAISRLEEDLPSIPLEEVARRLGIPLEG